MWNNHKINCVESHSIQFSSTLASSLRVEWVREKKNGGIIINIQRSSQKVSTMWWFWKKDDQRDVFAMDTMVNDIINQLSWIDWLWRHIERCDEMLSLCLHIASWIKCYSLEVKRLLVKCFAGLMDASQLETNHYCNYWINTDF